MNWFTKKDQTNDAANAPRASTQTWGSGAEQDRHGEHFSLPQDSIDQVKRAAIDFKGSGAEQDRYGAHFGGFGRDTLNAAVQSMLNAKGSGAEQDRHGQWFGLGYDGQQRVTRLAATQGVGAEQDRYGSHFGLDRSQVQHAKESIQDAVNHATARK